MGNLLKSWLFFTALLLFLLTASVTLPNIMDAFWGDTEQQLETAFADMSGQIQTVWAEILP